EPTLLRSLALGVDFDHLRRVARVLHEHYERLGPPVAAAVSAPPVDVDLVLAPLEEAIRRLAACRLRQDKLFAHIDGLARRPGGLRGAQDDLDRLDLLGQMPKLARNGGRHQNWSCRVDDVRGLLERADTATAAVIAEQRRATLAVLLARLRGFVRNHAAEGPPR